MAPFFFLSDGYLAGMSVWLLLGFVLLVVILRKRRRWKSVAGKLKFANALLSCWLLLAVSTVCEISFALFYDQTDSFNLTNTSLRWFDMHVHLNQSGYRDSKPFPQTLRDGQRQICFVGDSFTFGHGVPDVTDRFSDRIAVRLDAARPGEVQVANLALAGLDIRGIMDRVETELRRGTKLDTVVYTICLNDVESFGQQTDALYQNITRSRPTFVLFRETYLFNFLYFRFQQFTLPEVQNYYSDLTELYRGETWWVIQRKLDEFRQMCINHKVELRIVIFPFLHNVGDGYPFTPAHQRLAEYCRRQNVKYLDLEPVFRKRAGENLTVNPYDAHPNEHAHAIAAEAIEQGLLHDFFER